jgi:hypothetical protein
MATSSGNRRRPVPAVAILAGALGQVAAAVAQAPSWGVELVPVYTEVTGHDAHVLTVLEAGRGGAVELATEAALGYRAAVRHRRGAWAYGLDFFIHRTDQSADPIELEPAGTGELRFELPGRSFAAGATGEPLYFRTLEDTTVELWVADLSARRRLGARPDRGWSVLFGLRNADFDNDYRAIAGRGALGGVRIDASSNYSRLLGPLVGLAGERSFGRHALAADLRQSWVRGDVELTRTLLDFEGPPAPFAVPPEAVPEGLERERLDFADTISVPMTDLRLAWRFALGESWALVALGEATAWWDLAVPPGVVPGRADAREEVDLVTYGLGVGLHYRF